MKWSLLYQVLCDGLDDETEDYQCHVSSNLGSDRESVLENCKLNGWYISTRRVYCPHCAEKRNLKTATPSEA